MTSDALIGNLTRRFYQHIMSLPEMPGGTRLPAPNAAKSYLLYLHVPFCIALCPFCSFHRVLFNRSSTEAYFQCLKKEIELVSHDGFRFDELYVGGGTPTVMPDELLSTIELVRSLHPLGSISVETNPDDLEKDGIRRLSEAGVNRMSVGVQSFDDELLREMQRFEKYGSGNEIRAHLKRSKNTFDTLNVDMIFNFPHQTEASLRRDLDILVDDIGADQISYYPLMAADTTKETMHQLMGDVEHSREKYFYELIVERLLAAGHTRSSTWCFSRRPGMVDEYIIDREEYVGLGSGAFSYLHGTLVASTFSIGRYQQLIGAGKTGTVRQRRMSERDQMRYYLLMHLFGGSLDKRKAEARFHGGFQRNMWPELAALQTLGTITDSGEFLTLTEKGHYIWVILMREFFTGINSLRDQMRHQSPVSEHS